MASTPNSFKRVFGFGKEAVFAVTMTIAGLSNWFKIKQAELTKINTSWDTDEDEVTGQGGATTHRVFERKGTAAGAHKLSLELFAYLAHAMLGNAVVTGTTPNYVSTLKWRNAGCTVNPPSISYIEAEDCAGATGTWKSYKGGIVESIKVSFNGKGVGEITYNLKTDGSEVAQVSVTLPADPYVGTLLFGSMISIALGPLGTEAMTNVRSWEMTLTMNSVEPPTLSPTVFVTEQQYAAKGPQIDIKVVCQGDKSHALYGYYNPTDQTTSTTVKAVHSIVVDTNRQVVITQSQAKLTVDVKPSGNEFQITADIMEEWNSTDVGPGVLVFKTGVANYLVASP